MLRMTSPLGQEEEFSGLGVFFVVFVCVCVRVCVCVCADASGF